MELLLLTLIFFTSLFIGSFLGVLIDRIYRGEQFVKGRSYCEKCKHELGTLDLVPIFSYIFLNGKCRYCKKPIPSWLPFIEIVTAISITTVIYYVNEIGLIDIYFPLFFLAANLSAILLTVILILIFFTDLKYMVIPDIYLYLMFFIYPIYFFAFKSSPTISSNLPVLIDDLIAAAVLGLFFAALHYGSRKKAMGEGDIYLAALMGLYLGAKLSIVMWFVAFLTGAFVGVILLLTHKKKMKSVVPFGPFLIIGMAYALILGTQTLNWYLSF